MQESWLSVDEITAHLGANPDTIHKWIARTGMAGFVLANGSMSSTQSSEGEIRQAIVEGDLLEEWFGFVLGHVSSVEPMSHTNAASTGTKMPRASWNDIARFEVALPPESLADEFTDLIRPIIDRIIANIHESPTLAELRDALLPKLLSGQLPVPGHEDGT